MGHEFPETKGKGVFTTKGHEGMVWAKGKIIHLHRGAGYKAVSAHQNSQDRPQTRVNINCM